MSVQWSPEMRRVLGRLSVETVAEMEVEAGKRRPACINCGAQPAGLRTGRCSACYQWRYRHGVERPMGRCEKCGRGG
jgi:ribosomal protein L34E